eukprot:scaffold48696_cov32-Phaeocystis_antarctica.AAC.1
MALDPGMSDDDFTRALDAAPLFYARNLGSRGCPPLYRLDRPGALLRLVGACFRACAHVEPWSHVARALRPDACAGLGPDAGGEFGG